MGVAVATASVLLGFLDEFLLGVVAHAFGGLGGLLPLAVCAASGVLELSRSFSNTCPQVLQRYTYIGMFPLAFPLGDELTIPRARERRHHMLPSRPSGVPV